MSQFMYTCALMVQHAGNDTLRPKKYLQVVVLPLLLRLQVQPRETSQVLAAHRLVHGRAAPDALTVVVRHVRPPVSLQDGGMVLTVPWWLLPCYHAKPVWQNR